MTTKNSSPKTAIPTITPAPAPEPVLIDAPAPAPVAIVATALPDYDGKQLAAKSRLLSGIASMATPRGSHITDMAGTAHGLMVYDSKTELSTVTWYADEHAFVKEACTMAYNKLDARAQKVAKSVANGLTFRNLGMSASVMAQIGLLVHVMQAFGVTIPESSEK